jgi:hypothetical protein
VIEAKLSRRVVKNKLRHWPPGTDKSPFVPHFFAPGLLSLETSACRLESGSPSDPHLPPRAFARDWDVTMKRTILWLAALPLALAVSAQWTPQPVQAQGADLADVMPAYHAAPPAPGEKLPPLLSGSQLSGPAFQYPWQKVVYRDAAKIPRVIYQLPCFCRCDRFAGHTSLHSCFEGLHGAECGTCAKELYYAYTMTQHGKTVKQIRDGIVHGDYESIDLNALKL